MCQRARPRITAVLARDRHAAARAAPLRGLQLTRQLSCDEIQLAANRLELRRPSGFSRIGARDECARDAQRAALCALISGARSQTAMREFKRALCLCAGVRARAQVRVVPAPSRAAILVRLRARETRTLLGPPINTHRRNTHRHKYTHKRRDSLSIGGRLAGAGRVGGAVGAVVGGLAGVCTRTATKPLWEPAAVKV